MVVLLRQRSRECTVQSLLGSGYVDTIILLETLRPPLRITRRIDACKALVHHQLPTSSPHSVVVLPYLFPPRAP